MTFEEIIAKLPKPFYRDNQSDIVIYNADCRDILPLIPDKCIDLVLTDPPYNISYHYESYQDNLPESDYIQLLNCIPLPIVAIHYPEATINLLPRAWGKCSEVVGWAYRNPLPIPKDFRLISWWGITPNFENVKEPYALATMGDKRAIGKMSPLGRNLRDWWFEETIRFPNHENTEHPCQIPQEIITKILLITSGDTILDPFLGSGTTAVCAKKLGRKCIGIEIEEKYCEIAAKRLAQGVMRLE